MPASQPLNAQDPQMQLRETREYAALRGLEIVDEYTNHGISGSREFHPQLNRLMADAVLVWKVSRFGRSLRHRVNALAESGALCVAFISLRDHLDLCTILSPHVHCHRGDGGILRPLIQECVRARIA